MYQGQDVGPVRPPTSREDILQAAARLQRSATLESRSYQDEAFSSRHIGSNFNEWLKPVTEFGSNEPGWEVNIKSSPDFNCMDFNRKEWARSRDTVNEILAMLLQDLKAFSGEFKGLKIERYVRQGSSRDGLKVIAADEFDTLLLYHFEGFSFNPIPVRKDGSVIPEFCRIEVSRRLEWLQTNCPKLYDAHVFEEDASRGNVKLNARALHQVFESMIDRSVQNITARIQENLSKGTSQVDFRIRRRMNPPSINITIDVPPEGHQHFMPSGRLGSGSTVSQIDVDVVPGLWLRDDNVPDPSRPSMTMDCPVYAVFKWQEESSVGPEVFGSKPDMMWRICSSGYEKHTLDLARSSQRLRYVITALRLLKTYFTKTKSRAKAANQPPPPLTTVLRSYHLKHIAFYLILYLGYLHEDATITGVKDVLRYFLGLLGISLKTGKLPHFFHSNKWITKLYPDYPMVANQLRFNLLRGKSSEALNQAKLSLDKHLVPAINFELRQEDLGMDEDFFDFGGYGGGGCSPRRTDTGGRVDKLEQIKGEYHSSVSYGDFF